MLHERKGRRDEKDSRAVCVCVCVCVSVCVCVCVCLWISKQAHHPPFLLVCVVVLRCALLQPDRTALHR